MPVPPLYNVSNITNSVNMLEQAQAIHQMSGELFGVMLWVGLVSVLMISFKLVSDEETTIVIAGGLWFGVILALMLRAAGLLPLYILVSVIFLAGASVLLLWAKK